MGMVFDCFTFYNELDLLEIRLHELDPVVDKFVLVEASFTHQNTPKPFYFEENKLKFEKFLHKIIHIKVEDLPNSTNESIFQNWDFENHQRRCIIRGLSDAKPGDRVLISDLDEIPKANVVKKASLMRGWVSFALVHYAYYLNSKLTNDKISTQRIKVFLLSRFLKEYKVKYGEMRYWIGPVMVDFEQIKDIQFFRDNRATPKLVDAILENAGWHFSYLGGAEKILQKLNALIVEFDYTPYKNLEYIERQLALGKDIFDPNLTWTKVDMNSDMPKYITENYIRFKNLIRN